MKIQNDNSTAQLVYLTIRKYSQYILHGFIGCLIWTLTYLVFAFYKEVCICYLKSKEPFGKGFYYKYIEYRPHLKNIYMFSGAIVLFWFAIIFVLEARTFIIYTGFVFFITGYLLGWGIYYKYYAWQNDYFEEAKWILNYLKDNYIKKKEEAEEPKQKQE